MSEPEGKSEPSGQPRMRLVPPRVRAREVDEDIDAAAVAWAQGLHNKRRWLAIALIGNLLLLLALLGIPFLRGQERARATFRAQASFVSCLLGAHAREPAGIGASRDEAELFASALLAAPQKIGQRCATALERVAPENAIFVLPSVKRAEERVREAVRVLRVELDNVAAHGPGEPVSDRPLRALAQLRDVIRAQAETANLVDVPLYAALDDSTKPRLARTANLPIYASRDAVVSLWGDDHALRAVAVDKTGVSYLEVLAGQPLRRARLTRPAALRGVYRGHEAAFLVWATPEARCQERAQGCYGKTSSLTPLTFPLFELAKGRLIAAHLAGRVDRSLAVHAGTLALIAQTETSAMTRASLPLSADMAFDPSLPALVPSVDETAFDRLLLVEGETRTFVLASKREGGHGKLVLSSETERPLAEIAGDVLPWAVGCARGDVLEFASGDDHELRLGRLSGDALETFAPIALTTSEVVHASDPKLDKVQLLCAKDGVFALVRAADDTLSALRCRGGTCQQDVIARGAHAMALLETPRGALVAWSGDDEHPQIFVRDVLFAGGLSGPARVPGACWEGERGLCGTPLLARLGRRVLLAGREGADLSALESADDGQHWSTPPSY